MGPDHVNRFLTDLAVRGHVAASTQNHSLSAVLFLYKYVLGAPLPPAGELICARRPCRLPTVLTRAEVHDLLTHLEGPRVSPRSFSTAPACACWKPCAFA